MNTYITRRRDAALVVFAAFLWLVTPALAKRAAPKPVKPVVKDGIEYSAPFNREGFVVATWIKTGREIWSRQVYTIKHEYRQGLEEDVQTCFITELGLEKGKLNVINEQGSEFEIDPDTLTVTLLKGHAVIDFTNFKPWARSSARASSTDNKYSRSILSAKLLCESSDRSGK